MTVFTSFGLFYLLIAFGGFACVFLIFGMVLVLFVVALTGCCSRFWWLVVNLLVFEVVVLVSGFVVSFVGRCLGWHVW